MACPTFGKVCGDDAAEGSGSTGHNIGRIRRELGGECFRQAPARAKTRDEGRGAANGDLILGAVGEHVLADALCGLGAVVGVVDVDQAAPLVDEFLMPITRPRPQMAACSTASTSVPSAGCALAVTR